MTVHLYVTGLAKLEYRPEAALMRLFVAACTAMRFEGFAPQALANVINGKHTCTAEARVCRLG
jgi:urease beta subunit